MASERGGTPSAPRMVIVVLLATAALAGCIGSEDDVGEGSEGDTSDQLPGTPGSPLPASIDWGLQTCQAGVAFFDVPAEQVAPHLPEGFEPASTPQGLVGPQAPNPTEDGSFGMEMFVCEAGAGLNGTVSPISYGSYFAFAEPPDELHDPEVDFEFVKWDTLIPDVPRRNLLDTAGLPVLDGNASWNTFEVAGSLVTFDGVLTIGGAEHAFEGQAPARNDPMPTFVEWMETPNGLASWETAVVTQVGSLGRVTVDVDPDTLASEVLGSGPQEANALAGVWNFEDGTITLPGSAGDGGS